MAADEGEAGAVNLYGRAARHVKISPDVPRITDGTHLQ
jgi:hypothetical protein